MVQYYLRIGGSDAKDGLTPANAWATFAHAASVMDNGDVLIVGGGIYNQSFGLVKNNVTVIGDFTGSYGLEGGWSKVRYIYLPGKNIIVKWMWVVGYGEHGIVVGNWHDEGITNNLLEHVVLAGSQGTEIGGDPDRLGACELDSCWFNGDVICQYFNDFYVRSCSFTGLNSSRNIGNPAYVAENIIIKNCIFHSLGESEVNQLLKIGISRPEDTNIEIDYNCYYSPGRPIFLTPDSEWFWTIAEWQDSIWQDWSDQNLHSVEFNPGFKSDGFHLKKSPLSPCVDVGSSFGSVKDIDNQSRPFGEAYDIGCDEVADGMPDPGEVDDKVILVCKLRVNSGTVLLGDWYDDDKCLEISNEDNLGDWKIYEMLIQPVSSGVYGVRQVGSTPASFDTDDFIVVRFTELMRVKDWLRHAVDVYKEKGTCQGVKDLIGYLTGLEATCGEEFNRKTLLIYNTLGCNYYDSSYTDMNYVTYFWDDTIQRDAIIITCPGLSGDQLEMLEQILENYIPMGLDFDIETS